MKSIINITSGLYLNNYLKDKYSNDTFIPFNEAMIEGNPSYPLFDENFILERCKTHQVSKEDYIKNMIDFLELKNHIHEYNSIVLWFGKDMFCQLNLLTVLSYFQQEKYSNPIYLNLINEDTYEIIEQTTIPKDDYLSIYKKVFIEHQRINSLLSDLNQAIQDYLNYTNEIITFIKENNHYSFEELTTLLLEKTKKYGLGDTQIHKFIQKYKTN